MANEAEGASDQRDRVKDAELIVSVLTEDVDRVHRLVLAALGLAAIFVTQIPLSQIRALPEAFQVLTVVAVGLLTAAAVLLFSYTQKLNLRRLELAAVAIKEPPPRNNMHDEWGFSSVPASADKARGKWVWRLRLGTRLLGFSFDPADKDRRQVVWPLTLGTRLLGLGGLLLAVVVARLLLG